ncbi:MAG: UvrD-helicase domain-containing protein, partial [bacterium]
AQATILFKRIFEGFIEEEKDNLPPETEPDFEDLLIAANLIVRTEGMAEEIAGGLAGLLVDEFQDTDPLQWDTIRELADNIGGKFFWVGDPKQSIYKFRGADVSNIYKSERWVKDKGGEVFTLDGNYRTTPAVLAFANHTAELFLSESPLVNFDFHATPQRLTCERRLSDDFSGSVEIMISPDGPAEEAEMIARRIYCAVNGDEEGFGILQVADGDGFRPARWGDIAVLYPQRKPIEIGLRESLLARDIPFFTIGSQSFYSSEETIAVRDLILYLDDPRDKVALMAVLRGPLFALPDTAMYSAVIAGNGDLRTGLKVIARQEQNIAKELLSCEDLELTRECAEEIAYYESLALSIPPSRLVSEILSRRGMWAYFRGMSNGIQRTANLEKMLRILSGFDHKGISTAAEHFRIIKSSKEGEREEAVETEGRDAVRLMTVHQSKGLEFPIVFAVNLSINKDSLESANILFDGHMGAIVKAKIANSDAKSSCYLTFQHLMRERSFAETKRIMYVAMTRAKDNLILSGTKFDGRLMSLVAKTIQLEIPESGRETRKIDTPDGTVDILVSTGKDSWKAQIPEKKPGVPIYIRAGKGEFFNPKIRLVPEVDSGGGEYNLRATDLPRLLNSPKDNLVKSLRDSFPRHESPASPTGMDWGNMIHAFFENLPTPLPNADEIRNIATDVVEKSPFGPSQIPVLTSLTETETVA